MDFPSSQIHTNQALTDYAVRFIPPEKWFTWRQMMPVKVVQHRHDLIRSIDRSAMMRRESNKVGAGGGTKYNRYSMRLNANIQYACMDYVAEVPIIYSDMNNADAVLMYEQEQTRVLKMKLEIDWQTTLVKDVLRPGLTSVALTGADQFDADSPTSDPVDVVRQICDDIETQTGHRPNHLELHQKIWRAIQNNPKVLSRAPVHPTGEGIFTLEMFAKAIEIELSAIHITTFFINTAAEDQPEDNRAPIGPDMLIIYNEPPSTSHYGLGSTIMWDGGGVNEFQNVGALDPNLVSPIMIYSFPDYYVDARGGTIFRGVGSIDFKLTNLKAARVLTNCVNKLNTAKYGTLLNY